MPRAGIGNKLFVWAKAVALARKYKSTYFVTSWVHWPLGTLIRNEVKKRFYLNYFKKNTSSYFINLYFTCIKIFYPQKCFHESDDVFSIDLSETKCTFINIYRFPRYVDYFKGIKEYRKEVIAELYSIIHPKTLALVNSHVAPIVSVHIRLGDFKPLEHINNFKNVGHTRTPANYFIEWIRFLKAYISPTLNFYIFTDGHKNEIEEVLNETENYTLVNTGNDLSDMLIMSRSKIIITSAGSTFSYWAGFLSDSILIKHPDHIHADIRPENVNATYFEGSISDFDNIPEKLRNNLDAIKSQYA